MAGGWSRRSQAPFNTCRSEKDCEKLYSVYIKSLFFLLSLTVVQIEAAVHNPEAFAAFGHL